jgi:SsrA-binding protein
VKETGLKVVATNRSAGRDYFLEEPLEAGLALQGSEIKSVRAGQVSLKESYIRVEAGQAWLLDAHIAPYRPAAMQNHDPRRPRRLLLHRRELLRLEQSSRQKGLTLVPTRMYLAMAAPSSNSRWAAASADTTSGRRWLNARPNAACSGLWDAGRDDPAPCPCR